MDMRIMRTQNIYEVYKTQNTNKFQRLSRAEERNDTVMISSNAKDFQLAMKTIKKSPDVREDKVNDIKQRIDNNNYNVSSEDIADKILGH